MFDAAEIQAAQESREYDARPAPAPSTAVAVRERRLPLDEYDIDEPAALRPWLTIADAADYVGLPASHCSPRLRLGELTARNVGCGQVGGGAYAGSIWTRSRAAQVARSPRI